MRGAVYLEDGAIRDYHLTDGRHKQAADYVSWHLLVLDQSDRVCGCARYREYLSNTQYSELSVSRSALAHCANWGSPLQSSVDAELELSREMSLPYVELGGWALLDQIRCTTEAIRMALSTYGLAQALGGGIGISTATYRNSSSSILRRMGGLPLEHARKQLPSYYDPHYSCEMEVLRFYSWAPNPRYASCVKDLKDTLCEVPVVTNGVADPGWKFRRDFVAHDAWKEAKGSAAIGRSTLV